MPTVSTIVSFPQWRGVGLVVSAGLLEWFEWWDEFFPYVPVPWLGISPLLFFFQGLCIFGLAVLARSRGRHLGWSLLGLIPLAGPLLGLGVLLSPGRQYQDREQLHAPFWWRTGYRSVRLILILVVIFVLGIAALLGFFRTNSSGIPRHFARIAPDSSARVDVHRDGLGRTFINLYEIDGMFVTSKRKVFAPGDFAVIHQAIWSRDGTRIIFIGADSDTMPDDSLLVGPRRRGGWSPYLFIMFDRVSGQIWYNTYPGRSPYPSFTREEVEAIEWQEPLTLSIVKEDKK